MIDSSNLKIYKSALNSHSRRMNETILMERAQIHGLKFLSKSKHRLIIIFTLEITSFDTIVIFFLFNRWLWASLLIVFVICCLVLLYIWVDRFLENPTFIVLLEPHKTEHSFPAVIVCPEIAFQHNKIEEFIKNL